MAVKKNITLDGAAMILIAIGIDAIRSGDTLNGISIVVLGLGIITVKYFTREYL